MAQQTLPSPAAPLIKPDGRPDDIWYQRFNLMWNAFNAGVASLSTDIGSGITARIATQAEQEAASSATQIVATGRQQFHPSAAKAWAVVTVSAGTPTRTAGYNVSTTITDHGAGDYTLTFDTAFSSADFAPIVLPFNPSAGGSAVYWQVTAKSTTTVRIKIHSVSVSGANTTLSALDASFAMVAFGDQ